MANASVKKFQALIAALPEPIKAAVMPAIDAQAQAMARGMIFRVPVGEENGGTLRRSIRLERFPSQLRVKIRAGGPTTTVGDYDYSLAVEFGREHMTARPFFWPVYRARKKEARAAIKKAMRKALEQNWKQ